MEKQIIVDFFNNTMINNRFDVSIYVEMIHNYAKNNNV